MLSCTRSAASAENTLCGSACPFNTHAPRSPHPLPPTPQHESGDEEEEHPEEGAQQPAGEEGGGDAAEGPEVEEGETTPPKPAKPADAKAAALAARRAERAAAEEELKARRRMLGNIQFIGHLYRFGMLTENIMHRWGARTALRRLRRVATHR